MLAAKNLGWRASHGPANLGCCSFSVPWVGHLPWHVGATRACPTSPWGLGKSRPCTTLDTHCSRETDLAMASQPPPTLWLNEVPVLRAGT